MRQLEVPASVRTAATAEEAAKALAAALREIGGSTVLLWDPATDLENTGQGVWRVVWEGSGDPEWGVRLSLHKSAMGCRWGYLEPHHGFDVGFIAEGRYPMLTIDRTHQHAGCRRVPRRPGTIEVYRLTVTAAGHRVEVLREGGRLEDLGALAGTLYEWAGLAGDDNTDIYTGCWFVPARVQ